MSRIAAIDFGTNTFHLLIADYNKDMDQIKEVYRKRFFIYLNRDKSNTINPSAKTDSIAAVNFFRKKIEDLGVSHIKAVATEIFRQKADGQMFINELSVLLGTQIQLISGQEEARLIHFAVKQSMATVPHNYLIMDIGGGSNEFILDQQSWVMSQQSGLSILSQLIDFQGVLTKNKLQKLYDFLDGQWNEVKLPVRSPIALVINSGSAEILPAHLDSKPYGIDCALLSINQFFQMYDRLIYSTLEDRQKEEWIPETRIYRFPLFLASVYYVMKRFDAPELIYSPASLKEGLILHK